MNHKHKTWKVVVCALVLTTSMAMPIGAMPQQPPVDTHDRIDDMVTCIVKTTGTFVGFRYELDTVSEAGNLHLVILDEPYFVMGLFQYHGYMDEYYRYLIVSGYADEADWCRGPVDDLIGDFATKV